MSVFKDRQRFLRCVKTEYSTNWFTFSCCSKFWWVIFSYSVEDDVLYGVFVKGSGVEETILSSKSAVCVYSMAMVEKFFLHNIELCFRGETNKVISLVLLCIKSFFKITN